jgi:hypothetical protein
MYGPLNIACIIWIGLDKLLKLILLTVHATQTIMRAALFIQNGRSWAIGKDLTGQTVATFVASCPYDYLSINGLIN